MNVNVKYLNENYEEGTTVINLREAFIDQIGEDFLLWLIMHTTTSETFAIFRENVELFLDQFEEAMLG